MLEHYFSSSGPGAAIAVIKNNQPTYIECVGVELTSTTEHINKKTKFELASVTKMFTATAIMYLYEQKKLKLEDNISTHLPYLCNNPNSRPIKILDLLQHTSGLIDYLNDGMYGNHCEMTNDYIKTNISQWAKQSIPGIEFEYSNTNYVVLAWIIEAISGETYFHFLNEYLFLPYKICNTGSSELLTNKLTQGMSNRGYGFPSWQAVPNISLDTYGDGGLASTIIDQIEWQKLFWSGKILQPNTVSMMSKKGKLDNGVQIDYGIGFQIEHNTLLGTWVGHGGSWTTSTILVGRYMALETSVIVLSNEIMAPVELIMQKSITNRLGRNYD